MQVGTYPTRNFARLLSSVSGKVGLYLECSSIHQLRDGPNFFDAARLQMNTLAHHQQDPAEFLEFHVFPGFERMLDEEWNDSFQQMFLASHPISHPVAVIHANHAAAKMVFQGMQHLNIPLMLHDGEFREDLEFGRHFSVRIDPHVKTAFAVDKPNNPLRIKSHLEHS